MFFSGIFGISSSSGGLLYFKGFFQDIWGFFWKSLEFFFRVFGNSGSSRSPFDFSPRICGNSGSSGSSLNC